MADTKSSRRRRTKANGGRDCIGAPSTAPTPAGAGLHASADAALEAVRRDFEYWTARVTDSSFQLSISLIAANWAVFGSLQNVISNPWCQLSLASVALSLLLTLFGSWWMSRLHYQRIVEACADLRSWRAEFDRTKEIADPFPYTKNIESFGHTTRLLKMLLPLMGCVFFLIAMLAPGLNSLFSFAPDSLR